MWASDSASMTPRQSTHTARVSARAETSAEWLLPDSKSKNFVKDKHAKSGLFLRGGTVAELNFIGA